MEKKTENDMEAAIYIYVYTHPHTHIYKDSMSYTLNSVNRGNVEDYIGEYCRG